MYQQTHDAVTIKEILNHSDISVTLRYIGINQDNKDKAINFAYPQALSGRRKNLSARRRFSCECSFALAALSLLIYGKKKRVRKNASR